MSQLSLTGDENVDQDSFSHEHDVDNKDSSTNRDAASILTSPINKDDKASAKDGSVIVPDEVKSDLSKSNKKSPRPRKVSESTVSSTRDGFRRERKTTVRLSDVLDKAYQEKEEKKEVFSVPVGRGTKLGDSEYVKHCLSRSKHQQLKLLHSLCFGRTGRSTEVRRNLRAFNGFAWSGDEAPERAKLLAKVESRTMAELKFMLWLFGLESGGKHAELAQRIVAFLERPWHCAKAIPEGGFSSRRSSGSKVNKSSKKRLSTGSMKGAKNNKEIDSSAESNSSLSDDDDEEEGEKEVPKQKREASTSKKRAVASPKKKKVSENESEIDSSSSDDDVPLMKKIKTIPTDDELKMAVKAILKDADLETLTMKNVTQRVCEKFSGVDISSKKTVIKKTVKKIINNS